MKRAAAKMSQTLSNYHFLNHSGGTNEARGLIIDIQDNLECQKKKRRRLKNASLSFQARVKALTKASPDIHSWF